MNLNPRYRYCIIDTETTGLSIEDDDIIQIGCLVFDHNWVITDRFSHYIKPSGFKQEDIQPLIGYITGIDPEKILAAPHIGTVRGQIQSRFTDDTVIIGHNIAFDVAMISKHYQLPHEELIDTMDVTRSLLHYQRSYSLEIIHQHLLAHEKYQESLTDIHLHHHDALSDCYVTYAVFRHCIQRLSMLCEEYPGLSKVLKYGQRTKYVDVDDSEDASQIVLPSLKAPVPTPKTMVDHEYVDRTQLPSTSKIGLENAGFHYGLLKLVHPSRKMILAFAHKSKLDLAKRVLAEHGIVGLGYMRENQYIDPDQLASLAQQPLRDTDEVSRMIKYCSHHYQGLSVIDHNTPGDFKVFQRMRLVRNDANADIILSTHTGVYAALQDATHQEYSILFWDHQWRLSTVQKFYQSGVRIEYCINMIDALCYKIQHTKGHTMQNITSLTEIVRGVFGVEFAKIRAQIPTSTQGNADCLGGIPRDLMPKFSSLYVKFTKAIAYMYQYLDESDIQRLTRMMQRIDVLLMTGCQVQIQTSYQGETITLYPSSIYVDYADFRALFADRHVIFTQTVGAGNENITTPRQQSPVIQQLSSLQDIAYQPGEKLYLVQSSRKHCKTTFDALMKLGYNAQTTLLGENVTGGGNKIIEVVKKSNQYIITGGYELYMQCIAAQIPFDRVVIIGSLGVLHTQMVSDIQFYGS